MKRDLYDGEFRDPRAQPGPLREFLEATLKYIPWGQERFIKSDQQNAIALRDLSRAYFDAFSVSYSLGASVERLRGYLEGAVDAHVAYDTLEFSQRSELEKNPRTWVGAPTWMIETGELLGAVVLFGTEEQRARIAGTLGYLGEDTALEFLAGLHPSLDGIEVVLSHPRPYGRLIEAVQAAPEERSKFVGQFVRHWYNGCRKRRGWGEHIRQEKSGKPLQYAGYWCFSGAALTKLLGVDDLSYRDNEFYPEALLPR